MTFLLACTASASSKGFTTQQILKSIDTSGVRAFWPVMDTLRQDQEPSPEQWHSLFATPGYAKLQQAYVQANFRLAYMPSRARDLEAMLQRGDYRSRVLTYLGRMPGERDRISLFLDSFDAPRTVTAAIKECAVYLPKGATRSRPLPRLAFVIFEPDGHVDDDVVIFDALYAIDLGAQFDDILAHEFHHYFRPSRLPSPDRSSADYYIVHAVKQIQMEGIADLIDKKAYPIHFDIQGQSFNAQYNAAYVGAPDSLRQMDQVLLSAATSPQHRIENEKKFWESLQFAGHPTGFYMTNVILKHLGKSALIATEADPFEFFRLYNRAARKCGSQCYVFSAGGMAALRALESKYVQ